MLSALLGGLGSLGLNAASSLMSYAMNKDLLDDAQRHQIKMMQNSHQWEVGDLRKAGLNPILSAGGSPGSYSASAVSAGSTDLGKGLIDSITTAQDIDNERKKKEAVLLDEQKETQKSQQNLNSALASKALSEAMTENSKRAFEYSPEVRELKKRKIYNEGTKNLWQAYGDVDTRIGDLMGYHSYSAKSNALHGKVSPVKQKNSKKSSLSRLK